MIWLPPAYALGDVLLCESSAHDWDKENVCQRCGAWRGAYGLEPTVEMYVAHTIEILREIRRVLRKGGAVFWNVGDSYQSGNRGIYDKNRVTNQNSLQASLENEDGIRMAPNRLPQDGLKPKDLCLIPARVALAAQADGWWVRSLIIWAKPNPMPESVTDRPADAYEHIIMLTKSERYFWDQEAVREPQTGNAHSRGTESGNEKYQEERESYYGFRSPSLEVPGGRNLRNVWTFPTQPYSGAHFATFPEELPRKAILAGTSARGACSACGAPWERLVTKRPATMNIRVRDAKRGVADASEGYAATEAEIANYGAEEMGESQTLGWRPTCSCGGFILRERACFSHRRSGRRNGEITPASWKGSKFDAGKTADHQCRRMQVRSDESESSGRPERSGAPPRLERAWYRRRWQERIDAYWPRTVPCLVLDPFGGSGTTGRVAVELNRRCVLLDLAYKPGPPAGPGKGSAGDKSAESEYAQLARERTSNVQREMFA